MSRLRAMMKAMDGEKPIFMRSPDDGEGSHRLVGEFPVLQYAWPEDARRRGWMADARPEERPCPSWLRPGSVRCISCRRYNCMERCSDLDAARNRQSLAEALMAQRARRPAPSFPQARKSVTDACELHRVPALAPPLILELSIFFSRCSATVLAEGPAQLAAFQAQLGREPSWHAEQSLFGKRLKPEQRREVAAARYGRALWRLTRLELADMVLEEMELSALWLSAVTMGSVPPPCEGAVPESLTAYRVLMEQLAESVSADSSKVRTRCELAALMAPSPEEPSSFGDVSWACITNGTPSPTPRPGCFTLFARLPASARAANPAVLARVLKALEPLCGEMGLDSAGAAVPQVVSKDALFPGLRENSDVVHEAKRKGKVVLHLNVSDRWIPAPCASRPERFGNLVQLTWRGGEKVNLERHLRNALAAEFEPPTQVASNQLSELSGWGCCSVPHSRTRIPVAGKPGFELEAVSGEGPEGQKGRDGKNMSAELSTMWSLYKGEEKVAKCLMTYRNMDVSIFGPSIELIGVQMKHRGSGLGLLLHSAIATELTRPKVGWMPGDSRIALQAVYVVDYHRFFEKVGYLWTEEMEDAQAGPSLAEMIRGGSPGGVAASMMTAGGFNQVNGRRNEDGLLPLHRANLCAACNASPSPETPDVKLKMCTRCRCTLFCSDACMSGGWKVHKLECRNLGRIFKPASSKTR